MIMQHDRMGWVASLEEMKMKCYLLKNMHRGRVETDFLIKTIVSLVIHLKICYVYKKLEREIDSNGCFG